ncbi:hypothetical protein G3I60_37230 [Streptomyces sp. SID13666]|uniref:hypothetical protein n=1 Tax=unclassified Streptomyces TaxID=2593676 RepID=UPI0013C0F698|nr:MULTISPECIES: hypothetical protein [unclassified Streptomyces]NEA59656.1 hypothetical protein [Streptomyces sp. SID13666]NEA75821.1 hypothetical protein [Streptomyces sp. SID13588]
MPLNVFRAWRDRTPRRLVHIHRNDPAQLVVSLHGRINRQQTDRIGYLLAGHAAGGPIEIHLDLGDVGLLAEPALLFVPLINALAPGTSLTIHRAHPEHRRALHRLGFDRILTYNDTSV